MNWRAETEQKQSRVFSMKDGQQSKTSGKIKVKKGVQVRQPTNRTHCATDRTQNQKVRYLEEYCLHNVKHLDKNQTNKQTEHFTSQSSWGWEFLLKCVYECVWLGTSACDQKFGAWDRLLAVGSGKWSLWIAWSWQSGPFIVVFLFLLNFLDVAPQVFVFLSLPIKSNFTCRF